MTAERKKKTIEELKKELPDALSKLAGKSISHQRCGIWQTRHRRNGLRTFAGTQSLTRHLFKADKKARLGRKHHGGIIAFLFILTFVKNSHRVLTPPPPPPPLRWLLLKISPPLVVFLSEGRTKIMPAARTTTGKRALRLTPRGGGGVLFQGN
jgi:hypothetical protein